LIFLLITSAAGAAYLALALVALARFSKRRVPKPGATPSITVLKPIYGTEPGLYESLATFCDQDYPDFEIVFCMHDAADDAAPVVARIVDNFPNCKTRTVFGDNPGVTNPKIANLAKPGAEPHGDIVVLADSDIWVDRDYLSSVAASFTSERTGAVTCLYGAVPIDTLASRLGALRSEDEFAPSVLVAMAMGKLTFCLGATMAVRRDVLHEIGGIEALGNTLADDAELGRLVAARGYTVELSRYVVHTTVAERTIAALWHRELRWARTNFHLAPAGHVFSFLMYALPFAVIYAILAHTPVAVALLILVTVLRFGLHEVARSAFADARREEPWLIPLRDVLSLAVWAASLVTRNVRWRGARHRM
jgi:ceramide glucosyltransferase